MSQAFSTDDHDFRFAGNRRTNNSAAAALPSQAGKGIFLSMKIGANSSHAVATAAAPLHPKNLLRPLALLALSFASLSGTVAAHAILVRSTPKANDVVDGKELKIELVFNSRIDSSRSSLVLVLPGGETQKLEQSAQPSPGALAAQAAHLAPGNYVIRWQVLSNDGHITRGEIPFKVK